MSSVNCLRSKSVFDAVWDGVEGLDIGKQSRSGAMSKNEGSETCRNDSEKGLKSSLYKSVST